MQILDTIKAKLGFSEDIELANFLKKDKSTISKWRAKGEIPAKVERELNLLTSTEKPEIMLDSKKILSIRKALNMTQENFGKVLEIKKAHVSDVESGRYRLSRSAIELMKIRFCISEKWWETGEGEMFVSTTEKSAIVSDTRDTYLPLSAVRVPIISYAQAGVDGFFLDSFPVGCGFGEIYCHVDVKDTNAYALIVNGDSMYPKIEQGDVVVVSPNAGVIAGDCAVVKLRGGEVLLKRVRQKNGKYILESVNSEYSIIEAEKEEIQFCHKIVWIKPRG